MSPGGLVPHSPTAVWPQMQLRPWEGRASLTPALRPIHLAQGRGYFGGGELQPPTFKPQSTSLFPRIQLRNALPPPHLAWSRGHRHRPFAAPPTGSALNCASMVSLPNPGLDKKVPLQKVKSWRLSLLSAPQSSFPLVAFLPSPGLGCVARCQGSLPDRFCRLPFATFFCVLLFFAG